MRLSDKYHAFRVGPLAAMRAVWRRENISGPVADAVRALLREVAIDRAHAEAKKEVFRRFHDGLRLELGGGAAVRDGWTNIDFNADETGLRLDLRRPLPYPTESVHEIYSAHCLEHFSYPDPLAGLLAECFRVLRPGGRISIAVPHFGRALRAYADGAERLETHRAWDVPEWAVTPLDRLGWLVYMGGEHKCMFDAENGLAMLRAAGFEANVRKFRAVEDDPSRRKQSIYFEGVKP